LKTKRETKQEWTKRMIFAIGERIEKIRIHQENVINASQLVRAKTMDGKVDCGQLLDKLYKEELDEWRNLMLFGLVADNETRDRCKAAAYDRFLQDRMHVAHYFSGGGTPARWLASDEAEFRQMARDLFLGQGPEKSTIES
jgi:hypothetical protein